jgi:L-arabinokinase
VLAVYVSGHGFGHATRTAEVLAAVRGLRPELPITVVTAAPAFLFDGLGATVRPLACDVGLAQQGALVIDLDATETACAAFAVRWPDLVEAEAAWLRASGAALVLGDVPPLAFAAADAAGVASVGCANFSWDWIYAGVADGRPGLLAAAARAATAYARAGLLLELPFAGDLSAFPHRRRIPMVARRPRVARDEVRKRLGLDGTRPVVLLSFGGLGLPGFDRGALAPLAARFRFLDAFELAADRLRALGLAYPDVVGASDVIVTKPGYGIVTDAIAAGARLVYTDRGAFPEYDVMVREMAGYLPTEYVSGDDLRAGRLAAALEDVLARPPVAPPPTNGAAVAAAAIVDRLGAVSPPSRRAAPC